MHFLILCILSATSIFVIFVIFKTIDRLGFPSFPIIVINYLAATFLGFLINPQPVSLDAIREMEWLPFGVLIGVMYIILFFIIAVSSNQPTGAGEYCWGSSTSA